MRRTGRLFRRAAEVVLAAAVLVGFALAVLSWRLASGPLDLPWLLPTLEAAASGPDGGTRWTIGSAALAWEGFSGGVDRPFDIQLDDVTAVTSDGQTFVKLPHMLVSLSIGQLLRGRIVPRAVELRGAALRAMRGADGNLAVDLGDIAAAGDGEPALSLTEILAELSRPLESDLVRGESRLGQLQRVLVRDASLVVVDRRLNTEWRAPAVMLDLRRNRAGGAEATGEVSLALGSQTARLSLRASLHPQGVTLRGQASALRPALLATELPALGAMAAADLPVSLAGEARFDAALALLGTEATVTLGRGAIRVARGTLPLASGTITVTGTPDDLVLTRLTAELAPPSGAISKVSGNGTLRRRDGGVFAELTLDADRVAFADVAALWPDGVGGKGAKPWITGNITAGTATALHVVVAAHAATDFSTFDLTALAGGFDGDGLTVHWLRPIPPLEQGKLRLEFISPDVIEINVRDGRQAGLVVQSGLVRFTGLAAPDQLMDVAVELAGPLADVVAILRHPRLHLFDRRPLEMRDPAGQAKGRLEIIRLPLEDWITVDDVRLNTTARVTGARLGGIAAGRDLDQGNFDVQASNDSLRAQGTGRIAGIASKLLVEMDFRPGPPSQVIQTATVSATPELKQLATVGLDFTDLLDGAAGIEAVWRGRRDGRGEVTVKADLAATTIAVPRLNFSKPVGRPAQADIHVVLERDRVAAIDRLRLLGEGIDAEAQITFAEGKPRAAQIPRLVLGRSTNARAEVQFPARAGAPWRVNVTGASLDATAEFRRRGPADKRPPPDQEGPPYVLDARLDRVVLSEGRMLSQIVLHAENDGRLTRQAHLTGRAGSGAFDIAISPIPPGRRLTGTVADAGAFLRALDLVDDMQGGAMTLTGGYDDTRADHALAGRAEIADFRMTKAPALAKLLQAMTLYGLVELVRGPGLSFTRLEAPFRLAGDTLELTDARAFNASLGMTAKGRIDMATQTCEVQGTIVPAYFFNSLLGNIPFFGRLFSAEQGGGLFAANYSLSGACGDPAVTVNPLAALTPGFLRGIFGIFDGVPSKPDANRPAGSTGGGR